MSTGNSSNQSVRGLYRNFHGAFLVCI